MKIFRVSMQRIYRLLVNLSILALAFLIQANYSQNYSSQSPAKTPDFSGKGRPGTQTSGGSRNDCPFISPPLTALIPLSHWGKTVFEHPTLWFYVPYTPQQTPIGEFVLQDEKRNDIQRFSFSLAETPGFLSLTIPVKLELGKNYQWYFHIYCDSQKVSTPFSVHGWIERTQINPQLISQLKTATLEEYWLYQNEEIWYDAVNSLANLRRRDLHNIPLQDNWVNLLKAQGVDLTFPIQGPFLDSKLVYE
jgi:hypothetical protein